MTRRADNPSDSPARPAAAPKLTRALNIVVATVKRERSSDIKGSLEMRFDVSDAEKERTLVSLMRQTLTVAENWGLTEKFLALYVPLLTEQQKARQIAALAARRDQEGAPRE
jgi:hypothetical protein